MFFGCQSGFIRIPESLSFFTLVPEGPRIASTQRESYIYIHEREYVCVYIYIYIMSINIYIYIYIKYIYTYI